MREGLLFLLRLCKSLFIAVPHALMEQLGFTFWSQRDAQTSWGGIDSCIILMCLKGDGTIAYDNGQISYELGDTILIPNVLSNITLEPSDGSTFLEVMIP